MILNQLPYKNQNHEIRQEFRLRYDLATNPDEKQHIQEECTEAMKAEEKRHDAERVVVAKKNEQAFLRDPRGAIAEFEELGNHIYDGLGEYLLSRGVGRVKSVRFGKGIFTGKGTLAEGTISNFRVVASIGDSELAEELGCRNDQYFKKRMEFSVVGDLARKIAEGEI